MAREVKTCAHGVGLRLPCIDCEAALLSGRLLDEDRQTCTALLVPDSMTLRHDGPCPVHDVDIEGRPLL